MLSVISFKDLVDLYGPLAIIPVLLFFVIGVLRRTRRNTELENFITLGQCQPLLTFRGTLAVEENESGKILRLAKTTAEAKQLQFVNRWLIGVGQQAVFEEVTFDRSTGLVTLNSGRTQRTMRFSEYSAIRMREVGGKQGSLWHVELLPTTGRAIPFVTSQTGDRQASFEHAAPLARAVSSITGLPVEVVVDGKVWTQ